MVVAAGREERRLVADPLLELEAEHVAVESESPVDVGDLQVDVTDVGAGVYRVVTPLWGGWWGFCAQCSS